MLQPRGIQRAVQFNPVGEELEGAMDGDRETQAERQHEPEDVAAVRLGFAAVLRLWRQRTRAVGFDGRVGAELTERVLLDAAYVSETTRVEVLVER